MSRRRPFEADKAKVCPTDSARNWALKQRNQIANKDLPVDFDRSEEAADSPISLQESLLKSEKFLTDVVDQNQMFTFEIH